MKSITGGQRLRKVSVTDESENVIEMTFWPKQQHLVPRTITRRDIWALTGVVVATYYTNLQLESTPATTIDENPIKPETERHVARLRQMPRSTLAPARQVIPVTVVKNKTIEDLKIQNRFTCLTSIENIKEDKPWIHQGSKSNKAIYVFHQAPISSQIWLKKDSKAWQLRLRP
ncbi:hypothetical protein M8C21_033419, partial [Ambrosia artemisiifolia]